jgi:signal transduction histidine kinase
MKTKENLVEKLGEIAADLSSIRDMEALDKTLTKIVDSIVDVECWGLYFNDKVSDKFIMVSCKGFTLEERNEAERTAKNRHPGWVFSSKEMLYIKDTFSDNTGNSKDSKRNFIVRSRLWLPVVSYGEALGAFGFASGYPNYFNEEHISTLSFVCNLAGVVYNNLELLESKKKQNIKLLKANRNLMKINNSLDSFAYRITHDLRSPATNLKGLINVLNFLLKDNQDDEINGVKKKLGQSADILLEKLEGFVDLLKLESLNENKTERINLKEVLFNTISQLELELKVSGGKINVNYLDFDKEVSSIKEYLNSIFFNLIQNAIKYRSTNRELIIDITMEELEEYSQICICDNGEGIEKQYFDKLFTMFTRFSSQNTVDGTGIGLYIVKKQLEKINGKIKVESKQGEKTKFSILLPNN